MDKKRPQKKETDFVFSPFSEFNGTPEQVDALTELIVKMASITSPLEEVEEMAYRQATMDCIKKHGKKTTLCDVAERYKKVLRAIISQATKEEKQKQWCPVKSATTKPQ